MKGFTLWLVLSLVLYVPVFGQPMENISDPLPDDAVDRLGTRRMRYDVRAVAYGKQGTHALAISENELHKWALAEGVQVGAWEVSTEDLATLDLNPNRTQALISDEQGVIYEWDLTSKEIVNQFSTSEGDTRRWLSSAKYSPDESRILVLDNSANLLEVWNRETGQRITQIQMPGQTDYDMTIWGPNGQTAFVGKSPHPNIVRYNLTSGEPMGRFLDNFSIYHMELSPDGSRLLAGSRWMASEWDVQNHEEINRIGYRIHSGYAVPSTAYTPDGVHVITGSRDGSIRLWNESRDSVLLRWFPHTDEVEYVEVSPQGEWVLSYGDDNLITETSLKTGDRRLQWARHMGAVNALAYSPVESVYFTGSSDGTIRSWDAESGDARALFPNPGGEVHALAYSPAEGLLAAGSKDGTVRIIDPATGDLEQTLKGHHGYVRTARFLDGGRLLTCGDDGSLVLWNPASGAVVRRFGGPLGDGHRGGVLDFAVLPDGDRLVSAGRDGTLRYWDISSGEQERVIMAHRGKVSSVDVSADGRRILTGGHDDEIVEWNLDEGSVTQVIVHGDPVTDVAYLPGEDRVVSTDRGGNMKIWSRETGQLAREFPGHSDTVRDIFVDEGRDRLLSGSDDTTVLIWEVGRN